MYATSCSYKDDTSSGLPRDALMKYSINVARGAWTSRQMNRHYIYPVPLKASWVVFVFSRISWAICIFSWMWLIEKLKRSHQATYWLNPASYITLVVNSYHPWAFSHQGDMNDHLGYIYPVTQEEAAAEVNLYLFYIVPNNLLYTRLVHMVSRSLCKIFVNMINCWPGV